MMHNTYVIFVFSDQTVYYFEYLITEKAVSGIKVSIKIQTALEWKLHKKKKSQNPPAFLLRRINTIGINCSFTKEQFLDKINVLKKQNKSNLAGFSMMQDCCVQTAINISSFFLQ